MYLLSMLFFFVPFLISVPFLFLLVFSGGLFFFFPFFLKFLPLLLILLPFILILLFKGAKILLRLIFIAIAVVILFAAIFECRFCESEKKDFSLTESF